MHELSDVQQNLPDECESCKNIYRSIRIITSKQPPSPNGICQYHTSVVLWAISIVYRVTTEETCYNNHKLTVELTLPEGLWKHTFFWLDYSVPENAA